MGQTSIDPALHAAAIGGLEAAINSALSLAPRRTAELTPFEDQVFALHCVSPSIDLFIIPAGGKIRLTSIYEGPVTTAIRGAAGDFRELAMSDDPAATLINGDLELEGESTPLIELQKVLSRLDIDWEAPLVEALGDVAGHQLAQLLRQGFNWGRQAAQSLSRQLEEFIHEEARLSPPRLELEDFYRDISELEQGVERLQARTQRLRNQLKSISD